MPVQKAHPIDLELVELSKYFLLDFSSKAADSAGARRRNFLFFGTTLSLLCVFAAPCTAVFAVFRSLRHTSAPVYQLSLCALDLE